MTFIVLMLSFLGSSCCCKDCENCADCDCC